MASVMDDKEDSILEGQRTSLLDVIEDRNRALNKKCLLHRVVFISKMYHQKYEEIGQFYEKFFRDAQNQYQVEGVTGLLIMFPTHCIHVVETSEEVILELTRDMVRQAATDGTHLQQSKILVISHNIPHRLYQHWSFRVLDIEAAKLDDYEPSSGLEEVVGEILIQLLKLGVYLSKQPKVAKNSGDNLHETKPELLPDQAIISYLLEHDVNCIWTPEQLLHTYETPFDVVLDSGKYKAYGKQLIWRNKPKSISKNETRSYCLIGAPNSLA